MFDAEGAYNSLQVQYILYSASVKIVIDNGSVFS